MGHTASGCTFGGEGCWEDELYSLGTTASEGIFWGGVEGLCFSPTDVAKTWLDHANCYGLKVVSIPCHVLMVFGSGAWEEN